MKSPSSPPLVVLVLGGIAERAGCPDDASPLACARASTPHLDRLAREGRVLGVRLVEHERQAHGAAPLVAILGLDPERHETAPASYLGTLLDEALAAEECFLSADFVSLFRDLVADVDPGPLRPAEVDVLLEEANQAVARAGFRLLAGRGARHLAVAPRASVDPEVVPPEALLGRALADFEPRVEQHAFAHRLARELLDGHEINEVRRDLGRNGADMLWMWGPGGVPRIDRDRNLPVSAFGTDPVWRGLAKAAGIPVRSPAARTPAQLLRGLAQALKRDRICYVYIRRGVRDARLRERSLRVAGLTDLDAGLVGPVASLVEQAGGRLLVMTDAARDTATGLALADPVPVMAWGAGIEALARVPFTESGAAAHGEPLEPGYGLVEYVQHL